MSVAPEMIDVLHALADPVRLLILEHLARTPSGVTRLARDLPITRQGTAKHLHVLHAAGLIARTDEHREARYRIDVGPVRDAARVLSVASERWTDQLELLKARAEAMSAHTTSPTLTPAVREDIMTERIFSIEIAAPIATVWKALTTPDSTRSWYFGSAVESTWQPGGPLIYRNANGGIDIEGVLIDLVPPRLLVHSFLPVWSDEVTEAAESKVEWRLEELGAGTRVTVTHSGMDDTSAAGTETRHGWTHLLSALKTLLETGGELVM